MGHTHTSHVCFVFCLVIPLMFSCRLCLDDCNWHNDDPKCKGKGSLADNIVTTTMIQDVWENLGQVKEPPDLCSHFNGTFFAPGTCALDFSDLDGSGFLRLIDGVDSAGRFCDVLKGNFGVGQCFIDLADTTARGGASEEVKKDACAKLHGTWDGRNCECLGFFDWK